MNLLKLLIWKLKGIKKECKNRIEFIEYKIEEEDETYDLQ